MTAITWWTGSTLVVEFTVTDEAGQPIDISADAVAVAAAPRGGGAAIGATASITDGAAGKFQGAFAADVFSEGVVSVQGRLTRAGETQIVAEQDVTLRRAHV